MEGPLRVRVIIKGHGSSIHQIAASANGTVTAVLPRGSLRAALAELAGIDLRGVGLLLAKSGRETPVHCGVASFRAQDGVLQAQSLVVDTDSVMTTGAGSINLDSEALDLDLRGHPKGVRLMRLRSPLEVRGTLSHPSVAIRMGGTAAQTAAAVALGVLLTPLASVLAFVDPGLARMRTARPCSPPPTSVSPAGVKAATLGPGVLPAWQFGNVILAARRSPPVRVMPVFASAGVRGRTLRQRQPRRLGRQEAASYQSACCFAAAPGPGTTDTACQVPR